MLWSYDHYDIKLKFALNQTDNTFFEPSLDITNVEVHQFISIVYEYEGGQFWSCLKGRLKKGSLLLHNVENLYKQCLQKKFTWAQLLSPHPSQGICGKKNNTNTTYKRAKKPHSVVKVKNSSI